MKTSRIRIADIASRLGISTATVSRALSGKGYVREELAIQIRSMAVEMNYGQPENLSGKKVILVASSEAMLDTQRSQFTLYVLQGLNDRARNLNIEIENYNFLHDSSLGGLKNLVKQDDVIGALFLTLSDEKLDFPRNLDCPVVLMNSDDPEMVLSSVTPCNRSAAAMASKHLFQLGHKRILFINKPGRRTILRRLEGLRDVLGDEFDEELVIDAKDWTAEAGQQAIEEAISKNLEFSAVLAAGDVLAAGALMGLQQAGFKVPEDISVMGIDGLPEGQYLSPPLTTVSIPKESVGAFSLDLLCNISKLSKTEIDLPASRIELACRLKERASTGVFRGVQSR